MSLNESYLLIDKYPLNIRYFIDEYIVIKEKLEIKRKLEQSEIILKTNGVILKKASSGLFKWIRSLERRSDYLNNKYKEKNLFNRLKDLRNASKTLFQRLKNSKKKRS